MADETLSLNGEWQFRLGERTGPVRVPGVWELQGYELDSEGPAVYRHTVDIPAAWGGARIALRFGAVSYAVDVSVNGRHVGAHEGMWTAFEIDVTDAVRIGEPNEIELRILKPGKDGAAFHFRDVLVGFIPYVSLTFGGPWQGIELLARRAPAWDAVHISPDYRSGQVRITADLRQHEPGLMATAAIADPSGAVVASQTVLAAESLSWSLAVEIHRPWSPESPALYHLMLTLRRDGETVSEASRAFGFRELRADREQLLFNDRPIVLRGVLSWGWDPATLAPTLNENAIRDEFRRVREMGFNLIKLCLFVPPDILFRIADEEGMFLWLELPLWYQRMNDHLRRQTLTEYADILAAVSHHPSVILYSLGCELGEDMADAALLGRLNTLARTATTGVLICDNSGSGEAYSGLSFDFADFNDYHFYCDPHYFAPLVDHFDRDWRAPRPWIFGEFCDSDDFRDVDEITQANGGARPWWRDLLGIDGRLDRWGYSVQEDRMAQLDLSFGPSELVQRSRRQSFVVRKTVLEQVRSRSGMGGYVVTGLRDTPISTSGIFDDLNRPKFDPDAFRQFNADRVLTLEIGRSRVWRHGGDRPAPKDRFNHIANATAEFHVVLSNGGAALSGGELRWQLASDAGDIAAAGQIAVKGPLPAGRPYEIATLRCQMPAVASAARLTLYVALDAGEHIRNEWPMWVYPAVESWPAPLQIDDPAGGLSALDELVTGAARTMRPDAGVLLTSALTPEIWEMIRHGGRVLLIQQGSGAFPASACTFWRESITLLYEHPILRSLAHGGSTDVQFYYLAPEYALDTAAFAAAWHGVDEIRPALRRLDARGFGLLDYIVEIRAGAGTLLATTLNFAGGAGDQASVFSDNVVGRSLLREMLAYLTGERDPH